MDFAVSVRLVTTELLRMLLDNSRLVKGNDRHFGTGETREMGKQGHKTERDPRRKLTIHVEDLGKRTSVRVTIYTQVEICVSSFSECGALGTHAQL